MMKWITGILVLISLNALAAEWTGSADVKFDGDSTLHKFDGKATIKDIALTINPSNDGNDRELSASATLKIIDMDTDNKGRDKKMRKMFNVVKFPEITGTMDKEALSKIIPKEGETGVLPFKLTISGETNAVNGEVTAWEEKPDSLAFTVKLPVSLKAFKLKAPRALGFIKVADTVNVTFTITAKPKAGVAEENKEQ